MSPTRTDAESLAALVADAVLADGFRRATFGGSRRGGLARRALLRRLGVAFDDCLRQLLTAWRFGTAAATATTGDGHEQRDGGD